MSEKSFIKRRWKLLLNIATIVVLIGLAFGIRHQLSQTFRDLARVNAAALLLMIPLQLWNYHAQTKGVQSIFEVLGNKLKYRPLYRLTLELNFVNAVFPSAGLSGASYFAARLHSNDVSVGRATFAYVMKLAMVFFAFEILVVAGLLMLAIGGNVSSIAIFAASFTSALILFLTALFVYIVGSKQRITTTILAITKSVNRLIQVIRPKHPATISLVKIQDIFIDFHENYKLLRSKYKELGGPLWYGFLSNFTEIMTIYVVYIAFGHWINPGAIILAYAIANFAGLISVLPSGVGTYEAIMVAVMVAAGVPANLSLSVTIMYRVINTLIQLPPGYIFYHRNLNRKPESLANA
jgi:uncharacterized protein (TIRG00374 family)